MSGHVVIDTKPGIRQGIADVWLRAVEKDELWPAKAGKIRGKAGWAGSMIPLRFISGRSIIDQETRHLRRDYLSSTSSNNSDYEDCNGSSMKDNGDIDLSFLEKEAYKKYHKTKHKSKKKY